MQYVFLLIDIALVLWLALNLYLSILAYRVWRKESNPEHSFSSFLFERLGVLGNTFVKAVVYTVLAVGIAYLLYEIGAMIFS
jgi:hypothetical protein